MLGKPDRTIYVNLRELRTRGLVSKMSRGVYTITKKGEISIEAFLVQKEAIVEFDVEKNLGLSKVKNLEEELERRLRSHAAVHDLQKSRTVKQLIASIGLLGYKDIFKTYLFVDKLDKEYLKFLANLYIHSVKKYLDKKEGEMDYLGLKAAWQAVRQDAWSLCDEREGLIFDFKNAWDYFAKQRSDKLKTKMEARRLDQQCVFRKLRIFSFPISTRIKLVQEGRI